ncbi:bis(5'-nucleosyl)-tetraphosphatase (symmetrical) YqeK [Streptococcus merionis]|uniref:bis(5'-nucleosyl)-tetraphosphatase (symmetrical) YqeK n=1 Tax=Streptococcus merionis TaxID=400065 RepID=UPI0035148D7C
MSDAYETLVGYSRADLLLHVSQQMSDHRFQHVLGVEATAITLAQLYGCDPDMAGLAGLLHDYAKELPDQVFLDLIDQKHLDPSLKLWGNNIWHGVVGIYQIEKDLGITNPEILQAIARHTVGSRDMALLDKIIYVADYIEPGRDFSGVEDARELARRDLDQAVAYATARTIAHLAQKGIPIYPQTLETYNAYIGHLKKKA